MDIVAAIIGALILAQLIDGRVAFAVGLLSVVAFRLERRRRVRRAARQFGLSPKEVALVLQDQQRGDHEAALRRIEAAQEGQRAKFRETTGVDVSATTPEIGVHVSWADIVRHVFRVCDFDRAGTTIGPNDQIHASSRDSPYGYLLVESPILNQRVRLPIIHCDDFLLAASVFDEPSVAERLVQEDLLVTYAPEHTRRDGRSSSPRHVLHYVITPRDALDRYYTMDNDVHMRNPRPEKLFGSLVYEGEIRVKVNWEPRL